MSKASARAQAAMIMKKPELFRAPPDGLIRVSKILSDSGICSRRDADEFIARGKVTVDGVRVTKLGAKALATQRIELDHNVLGTACSSKTVVLHKPTGFIGKPTDGCEYPLASTLLIPANHYSGEQLSLDVLATMRATSLMPAICSGLMVFTTDKRLSDALSACEDLEKTFRVRCSSPVSERSLRGLRTCFATGKSPVAVERVADQDRILQIVVTNMYHDEILRRCRTAGVTVNGIRRTALGDVKLSSLPAGRWRTLRDDETVT